MNQNMNIQANDLNPSVNEFAHILAAGLSHLRQDNFVDAERYFEQYSEQFPDNPQALTLLGVARSGQKRYVDASYCFIKALDLDPQLDLATVYLGEVYCYLGRFERGLQMLQDVFNKLYDPTKAKSEQSMVCKRAASTLGAIQFTVEQCQKAA